MANRVEKTLEEWKQILTPEEFKVCRKKAEEKPYEGEYYTCEKPGVYHCKCCDAPIFDSTAKYQSGVGWPAFTDPINETCINTKRERNFLLRRIEVSCSVCDAHLGHMYDDGPGASGMRYCIYSVSMRLEEREEDPKEESSPEQE